MEGKMEKQENHPMEQFCGSRFWDTNLTWNTEDPDFTDCFQNTVLIWAPCIFLWVFSSLEAYYLLHSKKRNVPYTWKFYSKAILTAALIVLSIADIGKVIYDANYKTVYNVDYSTPIIKILTFTLAGVLLHYNRKYGMRTSGLLFLYWFLLALCGIPRCRTLLRTFNDQSELRYALISYMVYYPIVVIIFALNFFADAEPKFSPYPPAEKPCPEQRATFPSRMFFTWFDSLAWQGFKKPLEESDLWSINPENMSKEVVPEFEKYWKKSLRKVENAQTAKPLGQVNDKSRKKKFASVFIPLCKAFGPAFFLGCLLELFMDMVMFISPQLLKLLIEFIDGSEEMWKGYLYASILLLTAIVETLSLSHYLNRMLLIGLRIRTALIASIYRKALRMSNAARKKSTVGEIVNLMSVDAQRLMDITLYMNEIWSAPLQIALVLYFLWEILGPSVLAGLAIMIILIPINGLIANKVKNLQIRQMKRKDERAKLMNEVLNGIKVLKLYAWELSFEQQILAIRKKEIQVLRETAYLMAGMSFVWSCSPFLVSLASFATYVLIDENNILDSKTAFVSLSLFSILSYPVAVLPMTISSLVQASVSIKRINVFMNTEEIDPNDVQHDQSEVDPLIIENGDFLWDAETDEKLILRNINLHVQQGQLVAVVGTVGSGKSSLISAFLGEMNRKSGRINTKGSIAYVSQQAWIQNATLQDNILFGKPLDKAFYNRVVEACALGMDLKMLPAGDQTEIGEKGINLSGGQKQRVALARAVYSDAEIYFLDDPLSAVDAHVGKHIFENIIGPTGLLKKKTRVLVTHGITYLPQVDNIVVLKEGEITEIGTYKQLLEKRGAFADFLIQHLQEVTPDEDSEGELDIIKQQLESTIGADPLQYKLSRQRSRISITHSDSGSSNEQKSLNNSIQRQQSTESHHSKLESLHRSASIQERDSSQPKTGEKIIEVEKAETGSVKLRVYAHYLKSIGWRFLIATIIMNAIFQSLSIGSNIWLAKWSDDNTTVVDGVTDVVKRDTYLGVYGALGLGQILSVFFASLMINIGTLRSSAVLLRVALHNVLRCPMSFFDTVPIGRVLSRFTADVDTMDSKLPMSIAQWLPSFFRVIATLVVISLSTPIFISVIIPIGFLYYFIQRFYVATSRQLKRLESVSRSPIYSHFSESVTGTQTIRAYGVQDRFILETEKRVDFNQVCYYPNMIANRWLAVRLEMIGNLIIFFAALFAVLGRDTMSAGLVGLSISYSLQITQTLNWLVRITSDVETKIVAVERIKEYSEIPQEAPWEIINQTPPKNWPLEGRVEFRDFKVRYREGLDLVLNGLSFVVNGGEKIGIIGRTGAGKSSLTLSLFRIIEAANGKILIDGIDISKLGLHSLRSRLTIIPQDPVLFSGNLRLNLDPFDCHTDEEIWAALEHAHLKAFVQSLPAALAHAISEGGDNLSVGQRQLICLARALLRKTKILILDEATAAVDLETDDLIQRTIRQEFKDCTVLTIAHRLNTILDSDRVIVLDRGYIIEFESPDSLLAKPNSSFYSMAKDAGLVA